MIYALLDFDLIKRYNINIGDFIKVCKTLNVEIIQYRDKNSSIKEIKKRLLEIRSLWHKNLIINDYIELSKFCDGVHIGQEDLMKYGNIKNIRKVINKKIIGLSTHNKKEILEANKLDLDYIGLGAYRLTTTKEISSIGGKELEKIAKLSIHKVAIIGGVKLNDEIENITYKVIGSDICKLISTQ